jgi:hypothetical protein
VICCIGVFTLIWRLLAAPSKEVHEPRENVEVDEPSPKEAAKLGAFVRRKLISLIGDVEAKLDQAAIVFTEKEGMLLHPKLIEAINRQADHSRLEGALYFCFPTPHNASTFTYTWQNQVNAFLEKANTQGVLADKSAALASFVMRNLDVTAEVYNCIAPNTRWSGHGGVKLEEAACWFRVIAMLSRRYLNEEHRVFIRSFASNQAHFLALEGLDPGEICTLLAKRSSEYKKYKHWIAEHGGDCAGTLLWEAGKNVEKATRMPQSPLFPNYFSKFFLQRLKKSMIQELLCGARVAA